MTVIDLTRLDAADLARLSEMDIAHVRGRARLELARRHAREHGVLDDPDLRVSNEHQMRTSIGLMLLHFEAYAQAFKRENERAIGSCMYMGPPASVVFGVMRLIARGHSGLELDGAFARVAREHELGGER